MFHGNPPIWWQCEKLTYSQIWGSNNTASDPGRTCPCSSWFMGWKGHPRKQNLLSCLIMLRRCAYKILKQVWLLSITAPEVLSGFLLAAQPDAGTIAAQCNPLRVWYEWSHRTQIYSQKRPTRTPATLRLASMVSLIVHFPEWCCTSSEKSQHNDISMHATVKLDIRQHASLSETSARLGQKGSYLLSVWSLHIKKKQNKKHTG